MSDLKLHKKTPAQIAPVIGTVDVDADVRFDVTPQGRDALDERDDGDEAARTAAVFGNFDMVAEQQATIRELREQLKGYERANEGLRTERAERIAAMFSLEERLARLLDDGLPAPTSLEAAIEQLFDAEAVFAGAERRARSARGLKFDAQAVRDRAEAAAIVRLVGTGGVRGQIPVPGAMSPTEAKDRLEEDPDYAQLAAAFRNAARTSDECETELRIAASRVETLRASVNALAKHSPLTSRAAAISRVQQ